MPRRRTKVATKTRQTLKNTSFEILVANWLMQDGWQIFLPILDHGHKTDLLISDGPMFYRLQIKTVEASSKHHVVENLWEGSNLDYVIYFVRNGSWGVITPAFVEKKRKLSHAEHRKFDCDRKSFLREFHLMG